jgi:4-carboxymuconolactone decarboxylase
MDERERFELGTKKRRKVLGDAWVDRSVARQNEFNAEFLDLISRYAWGEIWTRPGLDDRTRRFIVIATTIALGRWEEYRLHVRAAITQGNVTKADIKEVIMQQAIYAGVPAANTAFHMAEEVFAEIEKAG